MIPWLEEQDVVIAIKGGVVTVERDRFGILPKTPSIESAIDDKARSEVRAHLNKKTFPELLEIALALRSALESFSAIHIEEREALDKATKLNEQLNANMTETQQRCSELLQLLRDTKHYGDCSQVFERDPTIAIFAMVLAERERQDKKWKRRAGYWRAPDADIFLVLSEEVGEIARGILERSGDEHLLEEIIQVAAVAICWAEDFITDARSMDPFELPKHEGEGKVG